MTIAILISSIAIAISITSLAISIQIRKRCGEIEKVLHDVDNERKIDRKSKSKKRKRCLSELRKTSLLIAY